MKEKIRYVAGVVLVLGTVVASLALYVVYTNISFSP